MIAWCVTNCFHVKTGKSRTTLDPKSTEGRQEWIHHKKLKRSDLNFLREVKETSKKCKSETLNPISTQGPLYHFTSNHFNSLKLFKSVPWDSRDSLKSRDPLGQGVQEIRTIFTTTLNVTSILILFWVHSGVPQRHDMWYDNSNDKWN